MNTENAITKKKFLSSSLSIIGAVFLAVISILYILYRSWSNKLDYERWKDYEDCGV